MSHSVLLSPLDQLMPSKHVRVVLAFSHSDPRAAVASLNAGLRITCAQIPYLKGSVHQSDQQGYLGVSWSDVDAPVQLDEVAAACDMPTYAELDAQGMPDRFMPASASLSPDLGLPVLRLHFAVIRGGFFLCISFHHNVMDSAGVADMLNIWATNTRSGCGDTPPEILDDLTQRSTLLRNALFSNNIPALAPNQGASQKGPVAAKPGGGSSSLSTTGAAIEPMKPSSPPVLSTLFTFEAIKIDNLSNALTAATVGQRITKNTTISALVWARISLVRSRRRQRQDSQSPDNGLSKTIKSSIVMTVNLRKYVFSQPKPGELFLGNLLTTAPTPLSVTDSTLSDLTTDKTGQIRYPSILPYVTSAIAASYSSLSSQRASSMYSFASNMPDVCTFRKAQAPFNGNALIVTSWMNFPFYLDFGASVGMPAYVRLPGVGDDADGLVVVLPRKRVPGREGNIEIMVALREDDMKELQRDDVFMELTRRVAPA